MIPRDPGMMLITRVNSHHYEMMTTACCGSSRITTAPFFWYPGGTPTKKGHSHGDNHVHSSRHRRPRNSGNGQGRVFRQEHAGFRLAGNEQRASELDLPLPL